MSLVVRAGVRIAADPRQVWDQLVDWRGQRRWIPLTTVRVVAGDGVGIGTRVRAFSGVGPLGLPDTFVVTAWEPAARLEVLHRGPVFRGEGEFRVRACDDDPAQTSLTCTEVVSLPGGAPVEMIARFGLPLLQSVLGRSLNSLGRLCAAQ